MEVREFIEERAWEQVHTPKNVAMALQVEATGLFQWKDNLEASELDGEVVENVRDELADVVIYALSMADRFDIDLEAAVLDKMEENRKQLEIYSLGIKRYLTEPLVYSYYMPNIWHWNRR